MNSYNMKENNVDNWKTLIISRYLGEYAPAENEEDCNVLKSSRDICDDLEEMGEFSPEEVSITLASRMYKIKMDEDGRPRWMMRRINKQITQS